MAMRDTRAARRSMYRETDAAREYYRRLAASGDAPVSEKSLKKKQSA